MKLVIVESPSKAKTIQKYLGSEYHVVASVGHIRDLPKSNKNAIDIPGGFIPHYEISKDKGKVVSEIKSLAKKADTVYLASDPDREGEAISWHVAEACGIKHGKRVRFYEITKPAIIEALQHPEGINQNLRQAQEARRVLDRLVGYDLSGLVWQKVRYGLSAGRVQSPALHVLAVREREIMAFIPEVYYVLRATVKTAAKETLVLTCPEEPKTKERAEEIMKKAESKTWQVVNIDVSLQKRTPKPPFTTSTLQQAASSRLGFAPRRAMQAAQKLYEAGAITYMRTDSVNLSATAMEGIAAEVTREFGADKLQVRTYTTKSKNAQEAHEAVRPTEIGRINAGATDDQRKLYQLIRNRCLASQMIDATVEKTRVEGSPVVAGTVAADTVFTATGSFVVHPGWLLADAAARGEDVDMPKLSVADPLTLDSLDTEEKQTEPPRRYSEAGLVKELEKRGIGRPSTYASIIATLEDREYAVKLGKSLQVTDTGLVVDQFLFANFEDYVGEEFTAAMEDQLDDIASGERTYLKTLQEFYTPFQKALKAKKDIPKLTTLGDAPEGMLCPKCGAKMVEKLGKSGRFYSCSRYPECDGARTLEGHELAGPKILDEKCPECGHPLSEREGRFGTFVACSNYPKCKYIKKDTEGKEATTDVVCPVCKIGKMTEKKGRFGIFYSCTNYPKCKNAIKTKPTGNICDYIRDDKDGKHCGALMMEGTKTIPERCSDKTCPNHRPDKLDGKKGSK